MNCDCFRSCDVDLDQEVDFGMIENEGLEVEEELDMDVLRLNQDSLLVSGLSDEVLLHIFQFLDLTDIINLSATCRRLDGLLKDRTVCGNIRITWDMKVDRLVLMKFLRNRERAQVVTTLDMSDAYWIPSGILRDIALPMANLRVLHMMGTSLSLPHLVEILTACRSIEVIQWTWDTKVEGKADIGTAARKGFAAANVVEKVSDASLTSCLVSHTLVEHLRSFVVEVPSVPLGWYHTFLAHPELAQFIMKCISLENLWIFAWPKTEYEKRKCFMSQQTGDGNIVPVLPKLKSFGIRVMNEPRIFAPRLVDTVISNMHEMEPDGLCQCLWLDHPLITNSLRALRNRPSWPRLRFENCRYLCIPLMEGNESWWYNNNYEKLKYLKITDGLPRIISLNGVFDTATELESIVVTAFNIRLDWTKFIEKHPKLKSINICQDNNVAYPEFCVALGKLPGLKKLSLPLFSLIEICNSSIIDSYRASQADKLLSSLSESKPSTSSYDESSLFKRSRVAHTKTSTVPSGAISGLDLVTASCKDIEEFELGFSTKSRPGIIVVNSLINISRWKNLKYLAMEGVPIQNGNFLIEVFKSCPIEFLSLKNLGPPAKCCYMDELCTALPSLKKLQHFRFEQNYIGSTIKLLTSLSQCQQLKRFLLHARSNDQTLDIQTSLQLMESCPNLFVLYIIVGATTKNVCDNTRKQIEAKYRQSRPGLSVKIRRAADLTDNLAHPITYPSKHYRELVVMSSRIGQLNDCP